MAIELRDPSGHVLSSLPTPDASGRFDVYRCEACGYELTLEKVT